MLLLKNKGKRRVVLSCQVFQSVGAMFVHYSAEIETLPMYCSVFKVSVLLLSGLESLALRAAMSSCSVPHGYPAVASWGWSTTRDMLSFCFIFAPQCSELMRLFLQHDTTTTFFFFNTPYWFSFESGKDYTLHTHNFIPFRNVAVASQHVTPLPRALDGNECCCVWLYWGGHKQLPNEKLAGMQHSNFLSTLFMLYKQITLTYSWKSYKIIKACGFTVIRLRRFRIWVSCCTWKKENQQIL